MATASFWKVQDNKYSIQFNAVKPRERKVIVQLLKGWEEIGSGFHRNGDELFIFSRSLLEDESIYKFVKELPFDTVEMKKDGTNKVVKTKNSKKTKTKPLTKVTKSAKIKGSRSCSKCGVTGHNSRTCKA